MSQISQIERLGSEEYSQNYSQKGQRCPFFSIFSKTVHTYRAKLFTVILHLIRALCAQLHQNRSAGLETPILN